MTGMAFRWFPTLLLFVARQADICFAAPSAHPGPERDEITGLATTPVADVEQFFHAIYDVKGGDIVLALQSPLRLVSAWWGPESPLVVVANQSVVLQGKLRGPVDITTSLDALPEAGATVLDWARKEELLRVQQGGELVLEGVISINPAPYQPWRLREAPAYDIMGSSLEPSVIMEMGSTVALRRSLVQVLSKDCRHVDDQAFRLGLGLGSAAHVAKLSDTAFYINGSAAVEMVATPHEDRTKVVGHATLVLDDVVIQCVNDAQAGLPPLGGGASGDGDGDGSGSGSSGVAAWVWALVGLGTVALVALAATLAVVYRTRRRRQRLVSKAGVTPSATAGTVAFAADLEAGGPDTPATTKGSGGDSGSGTVPSHGSGASPKETLQSTHNLVMGLPAFGTDGAPGLDLHLRTAWDTCPEGIKGLKLLSVIDRGGFATVFKGRWSGITVAVKVVEHPAAGKVMEQVQRESALATSASHPNVVRTYKVCCLGSSQLQSSQTQLTSALGTQTSATSSSSSSKLSRAPSPAALGAQVAAATPAACAMAAAAAAGACGIEAMPAGDETRPQLMTAQQSQEVTLTSRTAPLLDLGPQPMAAGGTSKLESTGASQDLDVEAEFPIGTMADYVATFIVMEFCDRGSLDSLLLQKQLLWRQDGTPDQEGVLRVLLDVALALEYLHSCGIVHGDIKAGNVLLKSMATTRRGYLAKLGDFGLSHMLEVSQNSVQASMLGTAMYMSPERLSGGKISRASDVFSFGILMWEVWEGCRYTAAGAPLPLLSYQVAHMQYRPSVPASCPASYADLMQRCWAHDAKERPDMAAALKEIRAMLLAVARSSRALAIPEAAAAAAAAAAAGVAAGAQPQPQ